MKKVRKVDLLYCKAKGRPMDATAEELRELRKYHVGRCESDFVVTKANISAYVTAVDNGSMVSFYDWCMNHGMADRRRKGSSRAEMQSDKHWEGFSAALVGSIFWGVSLYWMTGGAAGAAGSMVLGALAAVVLWGVWRRGAAFTLLVLPWVLLALSKVF